MPGVSLSVLGLRLFQSWQILWGVKWCTRALSFVVGLILQVRYRDENSEDMSGFARTNTAKRVMEVGVHNYLFVTLVDETKIFNNLFMSFTRHNRVALKYCIEFFQRSTDFRQKEHFKIELLKKYLKSHNYVAKDVNRDYLEVFVLFLVHQQRDSEFRRNICLSARELDCEKEFQDQWKHIGGLSSKNIVIYVTAVLLNNKQIKIIENIMAIFDWRLWHLIAYF